MKSKSKKPVDSGITFNEIFEGHIVAEHKSWACQVTDENGEEVNVPLAAYIEITDMDEATGEKEFKQYPFVVSISMVVANPHASFDESNMPKTDRLSLIYDAVSYMGGVPVDHTLLDTDSINQNITAELKAKDAKLVTHKAHFGTYAAQKGRGAEITYPQFKTYDAAEKWAKEIVSRYAFSVFGLCGFVLDRPINLMGETGWRTIEMQHFGKRQGS